MKKKIYIPPVNTLEYLYRDRCPHCEKSEIDFFDEGKNLEESAKLRAEGKVKPNWYCELKPMIKGHRACSRGEWKSCPLH